jgi:hypothetical protein
MAAAEELELGVELAPEVPEVPEIDEPPLGDVVEPPADCAPPMVDGAAFEASSSVPPHADKVKAMRLVKPIHLNVTN